MLRLRYDTAPAWKAVLLDNIDEFLCDHAHNERKVAAAALQLAAHQPRHSGLVHDLIAMAGEEVEHFGRIHALIVERGGELRHDQPDPYMTAVHRLLRRPDNAAYLLDRLLAFGIVEARGCERFRMAAEALSPGPLGAVYWELTASEARHHQCYVGWARELYPEPEVASRLDELLTAEAAIARALPLRPALH